MFRTANPALNDKSFGPTLKLPASSSPLGGVGVPMTGEVMTLSGSVNKTILAVAITFAAASWSWLNPTPFMGNGVMLGIILGTLAIAILLAFKQSFAPFLTPVYAVAEGFFLGVISLQAEMRYPGVVTQAVCLTFGTLFSLLLVYKSGLIPVTQNFRLGVAAATGGIFIFYIGALIAQMFGFSTTLMTSSSPVSLLISAVVVVVASLNLVLDFDFIEKGSDQGTLPKYMEWYAAFGLLVTLVWLYIEILRLMMKLRDR